MNNTFSIIHSMYRTFRKMQKTSLSILIVEDDKSLLEILNELFIDKGYQTICITGTNHILPIVEEFKPDLVLLDYKLPGLSGGELCAQIKQNEHFCKTPVIIYSAYHRILLPLKECGCDDFIEKPFNLYELIRKIDGLILNYQSGTTLLDA